MDVGDEAWLGLWGRSEAHGFAEVERPDQRIHRNPIAVADAVAEAHRLAVHDQ
jgi:hypothetical protein